MKLWKRQLRDFTVEIGDPWSINGKAAKSNTPKGILREIYDIAIYFPITITVIGPDATHALEMDEHMQTRALGTEPAGISGTATKEVAETKNESHTAETSPKLIPSHVEDAEPDLELAAESPTRPHRMKLNLGKIAPRTMGVAAGAVAGLAVVGLVVFQLLGGAAGDAKATAHAWETSLPASTQATKSLDSKFTMKLWTLEPGEADSVSWFAAGIVATNEAKGEISLYSQSGGKRIATHKIGDKDLRWATEFIHNGEPAVGLRIADSFVGISAKGDVQQWNVPSTMEIKVHGTTPIMTNAASEKDPKKIIYKALQIGNKNPVDLTVNREMATRAVDGGWIVQLDLQGPIVAMNPVDRSNKATTAHAVSLVAPTDEAKFVRHLDAGHGNALALWNVGGAFYVGVHPLVGEHAGIAASFVKSPFGEEDAKNWTVASGMNLALLGPYAFSLKTGELAEYSPTQDFTRAYGPAAVTIDGNSRRTFVFDHTKYAESARIIGFTGQGTILVRLTDGSVAAYGETGGLL